MYGPETAPPNFVAADAKKSNVEHGIVLRREAMTLMGHDGPVLAVRFDASGMYCVSCGKVTLLSTMRRTCMGKYNI